MASPSPSPPQLDPPECPVCLQPFDHTVTVPRVLTCGHSTCQSCLTQLPQSLPNSIRCPECTHLIKLPYPQGPTALPKNIALLHFSLSSPKPPLPNSSTTRPRFRFPLQTRSSELYTTWKDFVIPHDAVLGNVVRTEVGFCEMMRCRLVEGKRLSLVEVGRFEEVGLVEFGYLGKIMSALGDLSDAQRNELGHILRVSLRNSRVCGVLGLWLDEESGVLYLVSERFEDGLLSEGSMVDCLGIVGVELCEVFMGLGLEGFVVGGFGLGCVRFDVFGHVCVDLGEGLKIGRRFHARVVECMKEMEGFEVVGDLSKMEVFVSPEVVLEVLRKEGVDVQENEMDCGFGYSSDVWLLGCVLVRVVVGERFVEGMYDYVRPILERKTGAVSEWKDVYLQWLERVNGAVMEASGASDFSALQEILFQCLAVDPKSRPVVSDVWKSIRGFNGCRMIDRFSGLSARESVGTCLLLGKLCNVSKGSGKETKNSELNEEGDVFVDSSQVGETRVDDVVQELSAGKVRCKDLQGHLDCITGLCVGGGFLFSSSFDKTVNVWSLQDFAHVHTFRGHEHRVMAVVYADQEKPLCISADSGGGIFSWEIMVPFGQEPLKKWYEEKDWRYSGIHALAISESGHLYTGSGDRLIKAWSLREQTLLCTMEGHKSVVSTLAICNGVLYSGSWDGTVRLWSLHDHSPLAVFGEDTPGMVSSVLSLHADQSVVIAALENGHIKIWINDALKASRKVHGGAIFALAKGEKWVFTGGWDKTLKFQEIAGDDFDMDFRDVQSIACDSVVTALLYVGGILFVGFANKLIKVYYG